MSFDIQTLQSKLDQKKGRLRQLKTTIELLESGLKQARRELKNVEESQLVAQAVAQQTQAELEYSVSNIVTTALDAIFDEAYEFKLEFVQRRNKTEADIYFLRDGNKVDPMIASGGGAVDVAAFALRVALWNMVRPRANNTLVLDEPFRFLSQEYMQSKTGPMLKLLAERLNIQFIIVTHNQNLIEAADKVFQVKMKGRVSHVS